MEFSLKLLASSKYGSEIFLNKSIVILLACSLVSACATTENNNGKHDIYTISYKADIAYEKSDWVTATENYAKIIKLVPNDSRAYFRLGNILLKQGQADRAVSAYEAAILRDSDEAKYYNNLAVARIMQAKQTLQLAINKARQTDVFVTSAKIMLIRLNNLNKRKTTKSKKHSEKKHIGK